MLRVISIFGMAGAFLFISAPLRAAAMNGLGQAMFEMDKYSPFSYIALALAGGVGAVWSMAAPKPQ